MAEFSIKVSPDIMLRQADAIKNNVNTIRQNLDNIKNRVTASKNYWEGEASNLHLKSYEKMEEQGEEIIHRLGEHPNDLLRMAGIYSDNESKAAESANSLPNDIFS